jgi:dTDP-4-dehydrorhamnose reductase
MQGRTPAVDAIASSEYPTPAKRPRNSVLSNARLKERFGVELPSWEAELGNVLARLTAEAETAAAKAG